MNIVTNYKKEVESYTITFTPQQLRFIKYLAAPLGQHAAAADTAQHLFNRLKELDLPATVDYNVNF